MEKLTFFGVHLRGHEGPSERAGENQPDEGTATIAKVTLSYAGKGPRDYRLRFQAWRSLDVVCSS